MAFNVAELDAAITAHIRSSMPSYEVKEDTFPDDEYPARDANGQVKPYIIMRYGPLRKAFGGSAVAGVRHDNYFATLDAMAIGPTGNIARRVFDVLCDRLIGFNPGDGEISLEGSGSNFAVTSNESRPTQNVCMVRMKFPVNNTNVGEILTP